MKCQCINDSWKKGLIPSPFKFLVEKWRVNYFKSSHNAVVKNADFLSFLQSTNICPVGSFIGLKTVGWIESCCMLNSHMTLFLEHLAE